MLRATLFANAVSCAVFGLLFALNAGFVATLVGDPPLLLVQILGWGLIVNAAALVFTALRANPPRRDVLMFALGDFLWVAGTVVLLVLGLWITTSAGAVWSLLVAALVLLFGVIQWRTAPEAGQG